MIYGRLLIGRQTLLCSLLAIFLTLACVQNWGHSVKHSINQSGLIVEVYGPTEAALFRRVIAISSRFKAVSLYCQMRLSFVVVCRPLLYQTGLFSYMSKWTKQVIDNYSQPNSIIKSNSPPSSWKPQQDILVLIASQWSVSVGTTIQHWYFKLTAFRLQRWS